MFPRVWTWVVGYFLVLGFAAVVASCQSPASSTASFSETSSSGDSSSEASSSEGSTDAQDLAVGDSDIAPPDATVESSPPPVSAAARISPVLEEQPAASEASKSVASARYVNLKRLLENLGYQPVGLEIEKDSTLEFLYRVFSHPDLTQRRVRRVYAGAAMEYDPKSQSFTVGGPQELTSVQSFVRKHVPAQTKQKKSNAKPSIKIPNAKH